MPNNELKSSLWMSRRFSEEYKVDFVAGKKAGLYLFVSAYIISIRKMGGGKNV